MALTEATPGAPTLASLLAAAEPLDVEALHSLAPVMVFAPHADDESLGCGGLLALLHDAGVPIVPVLMTDGSQSHPNSRRFDAAARTALRNGEWRDALTCLGLASAIDIRLGLRDGLVPRVGDAGFTDAQALCGAVLSVHQPGLVVLPWRRDPHPDHRAAHALMSSAMLDLRVEFRCLEFIVWACERGRPEDLPRVGEVRIWRLDISAVLARKRAAIAAHRSQHGEVIDDDVQGFTLAPAMRQRAERPTEYFFEGVQR